MKKMLFVVIFMSLAGFSLCVKALEMTTRPLTIGSTNLGSSTASQAQAEQNNDLLSKILKCNAKSKFYNPTHADADADGCVGLDLVNNVEVNNEIQDQIFSFMAGNQLSKDTNVQKDVEVEEAITITRPSFIFATGFSQATLRGSGNGKGTLNNIVSITNAQGNDSCNISDNQIILGGVNLATLRTSAACSVKAVEPGIYKIKSRSYIGQHNIIGSLKVTKTKLSYFVIPVKN